MRGHIKTLSIVSVILLLSVACGGGSDRDVTASNQTSESSNSETGSSRESLTESAEEDSAPVESEPSSSSSSTANGNGETSTVEEEPAYEMFGDIVWPCNPGTATGATDQGVTDTSILIGGGDDRGYAASLGLNITQTDTLKAFVEKCNDLGGINGREVLVELYDAKIFEVSNVWLDACPRLFMMVEEGFAVASLEEEKRVQCELAPIPT